jgi:hypothetical protein
MEFPGHVTKPYLVHLVHPGRSVFPTYVRDVSYFMVIPHPENETTWGNSSTLVIFHYRDAGQRQMRCSRPFLDLSSGPQIEQATRSLVQMRSPESPKPMR